MTENRASGSYRVVSVSDAGGPAPAPGQFVMIAAKDRWDSDGERPYLGRAFSLASVELGPDGGRRLAILVDPVGPGTERLAALAPGEEALIVGPLGRPFSSPDPGGRSLLVGGGIGVAPLAVQQASLTARGVRAPALLGFRDAGHLGGLDLFAGEVDVATDDGHLGVRGTAVDLMLRRLEPGDLVQACGPPAMLEAVRAACERAGVRAELAMESPMACGFGACFGCAVPTREGYVRLCVDGPVLDADTLESALVAGAGHR